MSGLVHSILVMLDGCAASSGLPAFDLSPSPHPDDEAYYRKEGRNWWPTGTVLNDCHLHDLWYKPNLGSARDP